MNETRVKPNLVKCGITIESVFIPYSKSRNYAKKWRSLNWQVTIKGPDGRAILTTDYAAGIGHCPSYKNHNPKVHGCRNSMLHDTFITHELEYGTEASSFNTQYSPRKGKPILPDANGVMCSLLMDSEAIDHATFESWANEFGYDTDSREAEATYRQCLEIGLKLRAGLGDKVLTELRDMFQGY